MRGKEIFVLYVLSLNCSLSYRPSVSLQQSTYSRHVKDILYRQKISRSSGCALGMLSEQSEQETGDFGTGSRFLLSGIALAGAAETAFLTYSKFASTSLGSFCTSAESCSAVLNGPYSTIPFFNVPLTALAFLSYTFVAFLSIAPLIYKDADTPESRAALLFTCSGMGAFSLYLMTLLAAVIQAPCNFCYLSATLSFLLAGIAWNQRIVPNPTKAFLVSASSVSMTFLTSLFLFYTTSTLVSHSASAGNIPDSQGTVVASVTDAVIDKKPPQEAPKIKNNSSPRAMLIGNRLQALNAKMYGAFWCSHCNNQKQELGIQASESFEYVECAKDGALSQYVFCKEEKIPGFPTWQIGGELYPGEKDLSELEKLLTDIETKNKIVAAKQ